jgi:hypothetical protein
MSARDQLNSYIHNLERRLRMGGILRGAAILTSAALATTIVLVLITNFFAFSNGSMVGGRAILFLALGAAACIGIILPLLRLNHRQAARTAENAFPQFEQRLVTFVERDGSHRDPFIDLLAGDTLEISRGAQPEQLLGNKTLLLSLGVGLVSLAALVWVVFTGPGYLGYGANLLWTGQRAGSPPMYELRVGPGDASVRRNSDELITATPIGVQTDRARLYARYQSTTRWDQVQMQPRPNGSGFQFLFAGLPENVEYYVEAGALRSRHFHIRVVDLPGVKQIRVTYRFPSWTGLQNVVDEHGGDLRAVEGTDAELEIQMDRALTDGVLALDDKQIHLSSVPGDHGNLYRGTMHMDKDGEYHVAAIDQGQSVRLSGDFFIDASKANPPRVAIDRPGRDYRASPIEEVTITAKASGDFGLNEFAVHYSVNGGPEKTANLLRQKGARQADGSTVLALEDFKLVPGDLVSAYATAKDNKSESRTDMLFIQTDPFEREFSQSQQIGGGGGSGGTGSNQTDISEREKEIIGATWKQQTDKTVTAQKATDQAKFLSQVQSTLRDQALSLAGRLDSRQINQQNEEFNSFENDMIAAAQAMNPATAKLKQQQWRDAIQPEQKALQYLLRAEATFRKIQVAFGATGGGGGGAGSAGRDLASLFDLELDTEKNQYETNQTASSPDQRAKDISDALQKLDEIARRQQDLAQQRDHSPQNLQERWEQEMLRRDAEQLQRQMEQLANRNNRTGQQGRGGQSSQSGQSGQQSGQSGQSGQPGSGDPEVQQALDRLKEANEDMRHAAPGQQGDAQTHRAAERLREATKLLGSAQQQHSSGRLGEMSREADRLAEEEKSQQQKLGKVPGPSGLMGRFGQSYYGNGYVPQGNSGDAQKLSEERQRLADDLATLEKQLRDAQSALASTQRPSASKLRDALGDLDSNDLENRIQRSADWLRRGTNPNSPETEQEIASGLQKLSDQVHQAERLTAETPQGTDTALDRIERLRNRLRAMNRAERPENPSGRQGQSGTQGQQSGQGNGTGPGSKSARGGSGDSQPGNTSSGYSPAGGFGTTLGGGDSTGAHAYGDVDTGSNTPLPRAAAPGTGQNPGDVQREIQQNVEELNQLRNQLQGDSEGSRQVDNLIREMHRLDPTRFRGNPLLVEQLHAQALNDVDKLELQLQRNGEEKPGQTRSTNSAPVPPGYQDSVADYFRRLSNTH